MEKRELSIIIAGMFFMLFLFFVFFKPDLKDISSGTVEEILLPKAGMVLRFDFEEGSGTSVNDLTGNGHNGVLNGASQLVTSGKYGGGVKFLYGNNYLSVSDAVDIKGGQDLSISFWVKPDGKMESLVYKGDGDRDVIDYNISYDNTVKKFACGIKNGISKSVVVSNALNEITPSWHHVVCVLDKTGRSLKLYVDDAPLSFVDNIDGSAFGSSIKVLYIGLKSEGYVDSFRIYNKVLSSDEITELGSPPPAVIGPVDGLINYWMMDEGDPSKPVKDYVGGDNGVITGATWITDIAPGIRGNDYSKNVSSFNGVDNYITVSDFDISLKPLTKLSVAFWLRDDPADNEQTFISDAGQSPTSGFFVIQRNSGNLVYHYANRVDVPTLSALVFTDTQEVWKHIVITADYSTSEVKFYKDGKLISTQTMSNAIPPDSNILYVGAYSPAHPVKLTGEIDDVRIYNRILSSNEIESFIPGYIPSPKFPYGNIDLTKALSNISSNYGVRGNVSFIVESGKKIDNNSFINLTVSKTGYGFTRKMFIQEFMDKVGKSGSSFSSDSYDLGGYGVVTGYDGGTYSLDVSNFGLIFGGAGDYNLSMLFKLINNKVYSASKMITLSNRAPVLSAVIPNQTWAKGSNKIDAFNLNTYFTDPDGDKLSYSVSGSTGSINVSIGGDGKVNLTQPVNFTGSAIIRFVGSDSINKTESNLVKLEVSGNVTCTPSWNVGNWSDCGIDNIKTRTVIDLNNCGVVTGKPSGNESCVYTPVTTQPGTTPTTEEPGIATAPKERPEKEKEESIFSSKVFLSGLIVFIFAGAVLGFYFVQRYRKREEVIEEVVKEIKEKPVVVLKRPSLKPVYEEAENIKEMKDYINRMVDKGGGMKEIKEALISAGWNKDGVEEAANIVMLERFIKSRINTMSKEEIKKLLISKGWREDLVNRVLGL